MYFCIKTYIETQGEVCRQLKIFLNSPPPTHTHVVYATDRSKEVVPVLFLFCVALWFILRSASCFKVLPCSLCSSLSLFIPFRIVITSLGEDGAGLCFSCICLFVLFVLVFVIFLFLLESGVGCGFTIVALPAHFY